MSSVPFNVPDWDFCAARDHPGIGLHLDPASGGLTAESRTRNEDKMKHFLLVMFLCAGRRAGGIRPEVGGWLRRRRQLPHLANHHQSDRERGCRRAVPVIAAERLAGQQHRQRHDSAASCATTTSTAISSSTRAGPAVTLRQPKQRDPLRFRAATSPPSKSAVRPFVAAGAGVKWYSGTGKEQVYQPSRISLCLAMSGTSNPWSRSAAGMKFKIARSHLAAAGGSRLPDSVPEQTDRCR